VVQSHVESMENSWLADSRFKPNMADVHQRGLNRECKLIVWRFCLI